MAQEDEGQEASGKGSTGKRYSPAQKRRIVAFASDYDRNRGRGGVAAASKKYGVNYRTIVRWIAEGGSPATEAAAPARRRGRPRGRPSAGDRALTTLGRMTEIRSELARLQNEYLRLKETL